MSARALRLAALAVLALTACSDAQPPGEPVLDVSQDNPTAVARSIQMVSLPGGRFMMGVDPSTGFQNGYPRHEVEVPAFRIGRYEITFAQYDAFARASGRPLPADEGWGRGDRPVIHVSWADAQALVEWLTAGTGRRFHLPSEAEWEYAARGGTSSLYWWGDVADPNLANTATNTGKDTWEATAPVGRFPANPFGLYDVLGNAWEIVADCRHPDYTGAPTDGSAWIGKDCDSRVVRGGFFGSISRGMQAAARAAVGEQFDSSGLGFRLAEAVSAKKSGPPAP
jgi:formylglycine-generating enzyme required for sulfatase activity